MIAVIVPAHNEEEHIGPCLDSILRSAQCPMLSGSTVRLFVVADACTDQTVDRARQRGATTLVVNARNVGRARALGADEALRQGATWLAFTDADSVVAPTWLSSQLSLCADAVCGTIAIGDWSAYGDAVRRQFEDTYSDRDGHGHIHGANLGVSASAYQSIGGFKHLVTSEDVDLVRALQAQGARIAWSSAPRVFTSVRREFRAPGGFGAALLASERRQEALQA